MAADNNYVLGKGRVLFDRFADGSTNRSGKFRYFGNTTVFNISQSEDTLDHFSSDDGIREKDASVTLQQDASFTLTTDNVDGDNLALWFLGEKSTVTVVAAPTETLNVTDVQLGDFVQVGATTATPAGSTGVTITNVVSGAETISAPGNWDFDTASGLLEILPDAVDIAAGDDLTIHYGQAAASFEQVISGSASIYGAIYFDSRNPTGARRDAFFPYVKLAPDGDYALKGDDWQVMSFTGQILKLNAQTERVYWRNKSA